MYLYLKQKLISIGDKYNFTDVGGKVVFRAEKPALSLTKMYIEDASGKELYMIKKKLIAIMPEYSVQREGKELLFIKRKMSLLKAKFEITDSEGHAYELQGDYFAFNFSITYQGKLVGSVAKKLISLGDAYEINISDNYDPALFCCIALVIDNCIHNENRRH